MDLEAVKAASTAELVKCAIGAAVNAEGLLADADLLSAAGRRARAYALAALAVEEAGKAAGLTALAVMPASLRAQAPLGRMLEWHQLKLVGGLLVTAVPFGSRTMATHIANLPAGQVEGMLQDAQALAENVDRLKQRGLYADIDRSRQARLPSEVTETDVAAVLGRGRLAVSATSVLLAPGMAAQLADPPADGIELCRALVSAFAEAGSGRTPKAAADVMLNTVIKLQKQTAASDAWTSSSRERREALPASGCYLDCVQTDAAHLDGCNRQAQASSIRPGLGQAPSRRPAGQLGTRNEPLLAIPPLP